MEKLPIQPTLDLDLPPIVPAWPRPGTLQEVLLTILMRDGFADVDSFAAETGSHEVRKMASDLRDFGWAVNTYSKPAPRKMLPRRTIGHYVLDLQKINLAEVTRP